MKIAVSSSGTAADSPVDQRFGRTARFLVFDTDGDLDKPEVVDNQQNLNAAQGAGIQAAQTVARLGAAAVITGNTGPKAFRTLAAAGIKVYHCQEGVNARAAVAALAAGKLSEATAANAEGHWV